MGPVQLVNLPDGAAFVPITQTTTFNGMFSGDIIYSVNLLFSGQASNQPTILQTSDGQQVCILVLSNIVAIIVLQI